MLLHNNSRNLLHKMDTRRLFFNSSILSLASIVPFNQRLQNYFLKGKKKEEKWKKNDTASHQRFKKHFLNALRRP